MNWDKINIENLRIKGEELQLMADALSKMSEEEKEAISIDWDKTNLKENLGLEKEDTTGVDLMNISWDEIKPHVQGMHWGDHKNQKWEKTMNKHMSQPLKANISWDEIEPSLKEDLGLENEAIILNVEYISKEPNIEADDDVFTILDLSKEDLDFVSWHQGIPLNIAPFGSSKIPVRIYFNQKGDVIVRPRYRTQKVFVSPFYLSRREEWTIEDEEEKCD